MPAPQPARLRLLRWTLLAVLLLSLGINGYAFYQNYPGGWVRADLRIYLTAAELVHRGMGHELYDVRAQWQVQQQLYAAAPPRFDLVLPYNHPAFEALPYLLLRPFGPERAFDIELILKTLEMMLALWLLARRLPRFREFSVLPPALWVPAFYPALGAVLNGQDSSELLLLFVLAFRFAKDGRWLAAGAIAGVCVFKYQLAAPLFLLMLLSSRQARLAAGFLLTSVPAVLTSVAITGWAGVGQYLQLTHDLQHFRPWLFMAPSMPNLRGLVAANLVGVMANDPLFLLVVALSAALFAVAAVFCWKSKSPAVDTGGFDLVFAFQLATTILVSYHFYPYDFAIFLVPVLLALNHVFSKGLDSPVQWAMVVAVLVVCFAPLHVVAVMYYRYDLFALVVLLLFGTIALESVAMQKERLTV